MQIYLSTFVTRLICFFEYNTRESRTQNVSASTKVITKRDRFS